MSDENNFTMSNLFKNIDFDSVMKNCKAIENYTSYAPVNSVTREIQKSTKQMNKIGEEIAKKREEQELREKRNLQINEEKLEISKLTLFLLQSVNRDQKQVLENLQSLIDTISFNDKVKEANIAIIQQELLDLKQSTDNLSESFIKLVEKKMVEKGVETAVKYLFIGVKELFLKP
ncbi:hypothetical protein SAMN02745163_03738 [Clostridium cavendishii DSM 21758]|uniref:Uncharacterized protein n=1 Tax=Clostridium cavendishii DSM 21758 TaxID=1121302 RepID=A0A1M6S3K9_9CLOT|nr:hypothetical protein [Clostridium cavendishii]SHK39057.1 hypothetical protein SAMN02745163_03738 [Clostridium cavendishii DSM 21758]